MAEDLTVEAKRLHLGKAGQFEWEAFKDHAVDAERLERRFEAKVNATEQTLRVWQRDVKLTWPVLLNGRKLGHLGDGGDGNGEPAGYPGGDTARW